MSTTETATTTTGVRRKDPGRRERIARAAIQVVAERGVGKLTQRAVAAAAGVPPGSTPYDFATLDDLLALALIQVAEDVLTGSRAWARVLQGLGGVAPAVLARF